jgi:hypothetical protein
MYKLRARSKHAPHLFVCERSRGGSSAAAAAAAVPSREEAAVLLFVTAIAAPCHHPHSY